MRRAFVWLYVLILVLLGYLSLAVHRATRKSSLEQKYDQVQVGMTQDEIDAILKTPITVEAGSAGIGHSFACYWHDQNQGVWVVFQRDGPWDGNSGYRVQEKRIADLQPSNWFRDVRNFLSLK